MYISLVLRQISRLIEKLATTIFLTIFHISPNEGRILFHYITKVACYSGQRIMLCDILYLYSRYLPLTICLLLGLIALGSRKNLKLIVVYGLV